MDKQEQAATAAAAASTNIAGPKQTSQLHDHAQVLQEAASALKSLHDGESSESSSPTSSKRSSAVAPAGAGVNTGNAGVALQTAVEAAFASTSAASSSKKNKTTDDGSGDANADGVGSSNPKKRKQIDGGPSTETAANNTTSQFDEEIPLTFPQRLMELLDDEGNDDIIGWLPHGRGFLIYQKRRFAAELMGKYFKQSKFTSFTRKLNRWGFTRISRGPETGAYYHPYFRKGNARLCLQMTCQSLKGGPSGAITGVGAGAGASTGAEVAVASNTAPPSMLQHQEASAASAQLAVPKAAQMQQSLQQHPIAPAPGLPNPSPMAAVLASTGTTTTTAGLSSAELLRTETATESVLRLRQLQRQQEQLMIRQRQIREEIQAISAALPEKIAQERRQQQVMVAAASSSTAASASASASAAAAGQTMASAATPNATPATQATPPSGSTGTGGTGTVPAPAATTQGQDPAYSKAIVDAAIETLKRSNANSYLSLLMARQQQQGAKQAGAVSGPIAPAPAMATPAAATPATAAAANAPPTNFQSQLRQTVRAQLDQMRLAESQRRQQQVQPAQQAQQAQQMNQAMEGITLANDGRLKAGPGALHPAQAAAQSGTYRSGSQGQKRPSGAKRASAA